MTGETPLVAFDRERITSLLSALDLRMKARGIAAGVYLVGGAAIALSVRDTRRTQDVDVLVSDAVVLAEAAALAVQEGVPPSWLNDHARAWIPPTPDGVPPVATEPGLEVRVAPTEHLMAMKMVALRRQDIPDLAALAAALHLTDAPPERFAELLARVYGDDDLLQQVLGVPYEDVAVEAFRRGEAVVRAISLSSRGHAP